MVMVTRALLVLGLGLPLALSAAGTGYVTDKLEAQLRAGQGPQAKLVKLLPAGTPLTIVEQNGKTGYAKVRLEGGVEGWVQSRYLSTEPTARTQLDAALVENRRLSDELASLKLGREGSPSAQQAEIDRLKSELIAIRQASANVLQIQDERDRLQERVIHMEREHETLRREKNALEGSNRQDWFLIGAGVLFGGILIGVFLPRFSWRKKSHWDSF
jgi:SH3 domain protein